MNFKLVKALELPAVPGAIIIGGVKNNKEQYFFAISTPLNMNDYAMKIIEDYKGGFIVFMRDANGVYSCLSYRVWQPLYDKQRCLSYRGWSRERCKIIKSVTTDDLRFCGIPGYNHRTKIRDWLSTFCIIND